MPRDSFNRLDRRIFFDGGSISHLLPFRLRVLDKDEGQESEVVDVGFGVLLVSEVFSISSVHAMCPF